MPDPTVRAGQIWADRYVADRKIRIIHVDATHATVGPATPKARGRATRIRLDRLSNYRLVTEGIQIAKPEMRWAPRCTTGAIPPDTSYATEDAAREVLQLHASACPGKHTIEPTFEAAIATAATSPGSPQPAQQSATIDAAGRTTPDAGSAVSTPDSDAADKAIYQRGIADGRRQAADAIRSLIQHVKADKVDDVADVLDYAARIAETTTQEARRG